MKKTLKLSVILLVAVFILGTVSVFANETHSGACGDNASWVYDGNGVLEISGVGAIYDYDHMEAPFYTLKDEVSEIVIEDGITAIGTNAFLDFELVENVFIPASVEKIDGSSFEWCVSLTDIVVDEKNTFLCSVDGVLFSGDKTKLIKYPEGKTETTYTVPGTVNTICHGAFWNASNLSEVVLPETVKVFEYSCFARSGIVEFTVPEGTKTIVSGMFGVCKNLKKVNIPQSVSVIETGAFVACDSLTEVYYGGDTRQWTEIEIKEYNDSILNGNLICDIFGDANNDGKVTVYDALTVLKHISGIVSYPEDFDISVVDYDSNGKIEVSDATGILRYIARLE